MGSDSQDAQKDEMPLHTVHLNDFYLSKSEVTVEQYLSCVDQGVCTPPHWNDGKCEVWKDHKEQRSIASQSIRSKNKPVTCINWHEARTFAKWVGGDLPTEAQWEYAARSQGQMQVFPWGEQSASCQYTVMDQLPNHPLGAGCDLDTLWDVCQKPKGHTKQDLCDMAGNVWEWLLDEYQSSYANAKSNGDATCQQLDCSSHHQQRVNRGGGWRNAKSNFFRTTDRSKDSDLEMYDSLGFRVAFQE
jgi:iron(II)-dependent oxidoreductase